MNIGEQIKKYRLMRGWSQEELAKRMHYKDKSSISKIERGKNDILQNQIKAFADVLGVSPDELFGVTANITAQNYGTGNAVATGGNCEIKIDKEGLTPQESELIDMFRRLSIVDQAEIISMIASKLRDSKKG